jgi:serralysin
MAEIYGTAANEHLIGSDTPDIIDGFGGNDILEGNGGNDSLRGGPGFDSVLGGEGDDTIYVGIGADKLNGGPGDDLFDYLDVQEPGGEEILGGDGVDTIFATYNVSGEFDFSGTLIAPDVERLVCYSAVALSGEQLSGLSFLQSGNIRVTTSGTLDLRGLDLAESMGHPIVLSNGTNRVDLTGTLDSFWIVGGSGSDVITAGEGILFGNGGGGGDTLSGGAANDALNGDDGNDWLFGRGGSDGLYGGDGRDLVRAGSGNDRLVCGSGDDSLTGGRGFDQFYFTSKPGAGAAPDRITDFAVGIDEIRLDDIVFTALSMGSLSTSAFHVGSAAHDSTDRIIYNSQTGALVYDSNGNGSGGAIQIATLDAGLNLAASDFLIV